MVDLQEYLEQPLQVADWVEDFPAAQAALQAELEAKKRKKS